MQKVVEAIISFIIGAHGIILNSTILSVYFRKITNLGITDQILFSMVLNSLLLQCSMMFIIYIVFLQTQDAKHTTELLYVALGILLVGIHMSLWNNALLSICYFVKLVNISHQIFFQVKTWFCSSVKKHLLGSAVCSVIAVLPIYWTATITLLQKTNISNEPLRFTLQLNVYYRALTILVSYVFPFSLTVLCFGLSVRSIIHHVWRIRQNLAQSKSPQFQALVRAALTIILRMILDLTFMTINFYVFATAFYMDPVTEVILCFFFMLYPSIQSFVLIFGNPKLKKKLLGRESTGDVTPKDKQ